MDEIEENRASRGKLLRYGQYFILVCILADLFFAIIMGIIFTSWWYVKRDWFNGID
jgi:hypothetical protein